MPISKSEMTKIITLDLEGIEDKEGAKQEVLDYIREQMLDDFGEGRSPVTGRKWKGLSASYKKVKAGESSSLIANMELSGDMLDALEIIDKGGNKVEIGWLDSTEAAKAHGHTTGKDGSGKLPVRKLIPAPKEDFRPGIREGIQDILSEYKDDAGESDSQL